MSISVCLSVCLSVREHFWNPTSSVHYGSVLQRCVMLYTSGAKFTKYLTIYRKIIVNLQMEKDDKGSTLIRIGVSG